MKPCFALLFVLLLTIVFCPQTISAEPTVPAPDPTEVAKDLGVKMEQAWDATWKRFYLPETRLFFDYLVSYEPGKELSQLPKAEEVKRQTPNPYGYGTGMEDCMISAGVLIDMIVDRHAVTKEEFLHEKAFCVFEGIRRCATVHGIPGFLARGVCPEDGKSVYINSSRDQYTHAVHGLWVYYRSPLCDEKTKKEIGAIVAAIADRMIRNVIPENDYDSLRADGSRDPRGISRMWNVMPHEAARLPMIYAAAWNTTGDSKYFDLYQKYLDPAIEQSLQVSGKEATYALLQMQGSLELLRALESDREGGDPKRIEKLDEIMNKVSVFCRQRLQNAVRRSETFDLSMLGADWRTGPGLSEKGPYRKVWYAVREVGEAALAQLMDRETPFPEEQKESFIELIDRLDFDRLSSCGVYDLLGAYWKARRWGHWQGTVK